MRSARRRACVVCAGCREPGSVLLALHRSRQPLLQTPAAGARVSKTVLTQFGRALKQLGIEHIAAYSPQARGRSERVFGTLQDRLPKELALVGNTTVEAANDWLREVDLPDHNARFAIAAEQEGSAFVTDTAGAWRDPLYPGGAPGGQRQHGEMARAEPATAIVPIATTLRRRKCGCMSIRIASWRCSGDLIAWPTRRTGAIIQPSDRPHDPLPARPSVRRIPAQIKTERHRSRATETGHLCASSTVRFSPKSNALAQHSTKPKQHEFLHGN